MRALEPVNEWKWWNGGKKNRRKTEALPKTRAQFPKVDFPFFYFSFFLFIIIRVSCCDFRVDFWLRHSSLYFRFSPPPRRWRLPSFAGATAAAVAMPVAWSIFSASSDGSGEPERESEKSNQEWKNWCGTHFCIVRQSNVNETKKNRRRGQMQ